MVKKESSSSDGMGERLVVAILAGFFAAITLILYPVVLSFFVASHSGNIQALSIFKTYYEILFSKFGLLLLVSAGTLGFFMGADRIISALSFFWGTHEFWPRLAERLEDWVDEHCSAGRIFTVVLLIFWIVLWIQFT